MKAQAGDCILLQWQYFLVLGEDVIWWCDYQISWALEYYIAEEQLMTTATMQRVHWMVKEYFSRYMHVVPLWLGNDIDQLLKRKTESSRKKTNWKTTFLIWDSTHQTLLEETNLSQEQSLIVFPNLRALHHYGSPWFTKQRVAVDSGNRTEKQRNSAYWKIKTGQVTTLLCTASGIFHDWQNLSHTHIHQPHQWWYKSRRDPRYDVVRLLAEW